MKDKNKVQALVDTLNRKVRELESQLVHRYHFADIGIQKAVTNRMMGSGVILSLTTLGGTELIEPVCIKDGLSQATIDAIRADLRRSYDLTVSLKPAAPTGD